VYGDAEVYTSFSKFNKLGTIPLAYGSEIKEGCPHEASEHRPQLCDRRVAGAARAAEPGMPRRLAASDGTLGSLQFLCRAAGYNNVGKLPASALAVLRQSAIVTVPWNEVFSRPQAILPKLDRSSQAVRDGAQAGEPGWSDIRIL